MEDLRRRDIWISLLIFSISFAIYLKTLCPTVYWADSGEFITTCYILGIPHSPGYPLYTLMGRLFALLPFGSVAYRVNFMSAFFASLTIVLVYLIVLKIQVNGSTGQRVNGPTGKPANWQTGGPLVSHIPAIVASLCFAFSRTFWFQALIAEVYTLNAFFLALLIFILLKWKESCSLRPAACSYYLYLFALIYGLSLGNHLSMLLFAPPFFFFLFSNRRLLKIEDIPWATFLFFIGLSTYLYLPLRSSINPIIDSGNPETLKNFLSLVTSKESQFLFFSGSLAQIMGRIKIFFSSLTQEFTLPCALFILPGIYFSWKRKRKIFFFLLITFLTYTIFTLGYNIPHSEVYYLHFFIPSYLILSLLLGVGISGMGERLLSLKEIAPGRDLSLVILLMVSLSLSPLITHYHRNDKSRAFFAYDYGMNVLASLEKDSLLLVRSCNLYNPLSYLQHVEKRREDVTPIWEYLLSFPWYLEGIEERLSLSSKSLDSKRIIKEIIEKNIKNFPIYYTVLDLEALYLNFNYVTIDLPLVSRIWTKEGSPPLVKIDYQMRGIFDERLYKDEITQIQLSNYAALYLEEGNSYLAEGLSEKAIDAAKKALILNPNHALARNTLGIIYAQRGRYDEARMEWERALEIEPHNRMIQENLKRLEKEGY